MTAPHIGNREQTSCDSYACQREEQCDECFLIDHLKECEYCEHYDHPVKDEIKNF